MLRFGRTLKKPASLVLASLNASTYYEVRLGISLVEASLDSLVECPAGQVRWRVYG
jgi:hypothetical protein